MPQAFTPTNSNFAFTAPTVQVWIGGQRRTDAVALECSLTTGATAGRALISFPKADFDAMLAREADLVEIIIQPYGVIFRGFIAGRTADMEKGPQYTATDISERFNSQYAKDDFNQKDSVTGEVTNAFTCRDLAKLAHLNYLEWRALAMPEEYALSIDLESFPSLPAGAQSCKGQGWLQALDAILQSADPRLRLTCEHTAAASTLKCVTLGKGATRIVTRGTMPEESYLRQPEGTANVGGMGKATDASQSYTHISADGARRIVETGVLPKQNWNAVADDFTPPPGKTIEDYVRQAETDLVINNWERYTTERIDFKGKEIESFSIANANYRKKYERVARHFSIAPIQDQYHRDDDADAYPALLGGPRAVEYQSDCVQKFDGKAVKPFVVYKRIGDEKLYTTADGFSIEANKELVFEKPFVDTVSLVPFKGTNGYSAEDWDEGTGISTYGVTDGNQLGPDGPGAYDFTKLDADKLAARKYFLILGEFNTAYPIIGVGDGELYVGGNVSGAGVSSSGEEEGAPDPQAKGSNWFILEGNPIMAQGEGGAGDDADGSYKISDTGSETVNSDYAGMYLVTGDYDPETGFTGDPSSYKSHRIIGSSEQYIFTDGGDLSGDSDKWQIVNMQTERKRAFEWIALNVAYESTQTLNFAAAFGSARTKRIFYKQDTRFAWRTQYCNFQLVKEGDKFTATFNEERIDSVKQLNELAAWAGTQCKGIGDVDTRYDITIPLMDLTMRIGDRIKDTGRIANASVTGISHDLTNFETRVTAGSY